MAEPRATQPYITKTEKWNKRVYGKTINGDFKGYYATGQIQHEFKFNDAGKREGEQVYKYENGQIAVKGNFTNGKESGLVKEFYETGELKSEKNFNNGDVDLATIKTYDAKKEIVKKSDVPQNKAPDIKIKKDEKIINAKITPTILNGKHILYNSNKQITKDGNFVENRLMDGKAYIYNENGILTRIAIYKNGMYSGDGVIEN
jgi:antitoxin component YwqK of YwqJK toxin-antitoxin module